MLFSTRKLVVATVALLSSSATAQTWTACNPLTTTCPANKALGMAINVDFTKGGVNSFASSGPISYSSDNGAQFTVAKSGDAPQLTSGFYIMFGRVEFTMKAAPGAGIVSSFVLQSDTLDEIDMEWLGADGSEVQTNYFGKGNVTTYNRGQYNPAPNNQNQFITYVVDWTADRIVWTVGGTTVRTLAYAQADVNQYPQSPMQVKFGAWSGGDYSNAPGTIEWARGPTDYTKGPFSMYVKSVKVTDYSTGKEYKYGDNSGSWQSIVAVDGKVNGNQGKAGTLTVTASATSANGVSPSVPAGGIAKGSSTTTQAASVPDGWVMTPSGKVVPASSTTSLPVPSFSLAPSPSPSPSSVPSPIGGLETLTTYDDRGFLTTMTVPAGWNTRPKSYDSKGFLVVPAPTAAPAPPVVSAAAAAAAAAVANSGNTPNTPSTSGNTPVVQQNSQALTAEAPRRNHLPVWVIFCSLAFTMLRSVL